MKCPECGIECEKSKEFGEPWFDCKACCIGFLDEEKEHKRIEDHYKKYEEKEQ